ncbi:hypothetical protein HDU67_008232 [Dinochytrium kinnereticum]|nr:hypothetical protein HDU67_008232 [Dinochytrium kinnereticum]
MASLQWTTGGRTSRPSSRHGPLISRPETPQRPPSSHLHRPSSPSSPTGTHRRHSTAAASKPPHHLTTALPAGREAQRDGDGEGGVREALEGVEERSEEKVSVTMDTSIILQKCRPLPEDIASLDDADTACTFCGVSYLLLSKYERLVKHVSRVEEDMGTLKSYAVEHPMLVSRVKELEGLHKESLESVIRLEEEALAQKEEAGKTIRALHELQLRHTRLTHEMETSLQNCAWMEDGLRSQLRLLARSVLDVMDALKEHRKDLDHVRGGVQKLFQTSWESLSTNLSTSLLSGLPRLLSSSAQKMVAKVEAVHQAAKKSLQDEIRHLKDELKHSDERYAELLRDLENTKDEFERHLRMQREEGVEVRGRCVEMEERVSELTAEIADVRGLNAKLEASERDLKHRLKQDREDLERENLHLKTKELELEKLIRAKDSEIAELEARRDEERKSVASHEASALVTANRSLAQKEDLNKTIESMKTERLKTIEAHQSRQLEGVRGNLQSQLDAARLSRDTAWTEVKKKAALVEAEWKQKLDASSNEIEMLKSTINFLQKQLESVKSQPPPPPPESPAPPIASSTLTNLQTEINRRDAEIKFLKETVRVECEERMGLLALVDGLRRGAKPAFPSVTAGDSLVETKKNRGSRNGGSSIKGERSEDVEGRSNEGVSTNPELNVYQSMAAAAAAKKSQKLRSAASKTKLMV